MLKMLFVILFEPFFVYRITTLSSIDWVVIFLKNLVSQSNEFNFLKNAFQVFLLTFYHHRVSVDYSIYSFHFHQIDEQWLFFFAQDKAPIWQNSLFDRIIQYFWINYGTSLTVSFCRARSQEHKDTNLMKRWINWDSFFSNIKICFITKLQSLIFKKK